MTLQQLRYFCEIAAHDWNISKAAKSLHTSQPGMSRQMQALEKELGTVIFLRRKKRIVGVTAVGSIALAKAQRIIRESTNLKLLGGHFDKKGGNTIKIAATYTQARYVLPRVVRDFVRSHPDMEIFLKQGLPSELAELVERGDADLSLSSMPPTVPENVVILRCAAVERIAVVPAGHPLARSRKLTLEQIAKFPIITYDSAYIGRSAVLGAFERAGLAPKIAISAVDADVMKAYVAQGLGVAIISAVAWGTADDKALRAIQVSDLFGQDTIYICLRRHQHLRRPVREFIAAFAPQIEESSIAEAIYGTAIEL
jgi:LysR family transcriptional regulator, cys regulon transcriptional activator